MSTQTIKKFKGFNILDMVIVVLVIAVLGAFFGSSLFKKVETKEYGTQIEYVIRTGSVRVQTVDALKKDLGLLDGETGNTIGKIVSVEVKPYTENRTKADGTVVSVEIPDRYTVYSTLRCDGLINQSGYFVSSRQLAPGASFRIVGEGVDTSGTVVSVKEIVRA